MTKQAGHTAGPWETDNSWSLHGKARPDMMDYRCNVDAPVPFTENEHGDFERVETQTGATAFGRTPKEAQANAQLIAETFTVAHETGLTPRQLAEQRDELLAALYHAREALEYGAPEFEATGEGGKLTLDIIDAAIAKAEGGAA